MAFFKIKQMFGIEGTQADGTSAFSLVCGATDNATVVKDGPGHLLEVHCINTNAAVRYLKLYDTNKIATGNVGTPVRRYAIPGNATGAGFVLQGLPRKFTRGIAFRIVTGVADNDNTSPSANDVILTMEYV